MPIDRDSLAAVIAGWLPQARWFAGKARRIAGATLVDAIAPPDAPFVLAIIDVAFAPGAPQRYVVPADPDTGVDAAATPACAAWLVEAALGRRTVLTPHGRFAGERCGPPPPATGPVMVAPLGADASNTSLRVRAGDRDLALKILRRVRPGIQPEVEVGAFLAEVGWPGTPRLLGWLEHAPHGAPPAVLATVHEFATGCTGAWDLLVDLVVAHGLAGPARARILALVESIGRATAEMHAALASRPDDPAFAPVVPTPAERAAAAERMAAHATGVLERVRAAAAAAPPALATRLAALAGAAPVIATRLRETSDLSVGTAWIRVHGDYHLGQVLVAPGDRPLVIDFEGEPGRSLEERRARTSAARDVAGMCRSFDYLLRHAARTGGPTYDPALLALLERTFLDAYAAGTRGVAWWPADPDDAARLLAAHVLDKAVYELVYELDNRPDWVEVPLAALEGLVMP